MTGFPPATGAFSPLGTPLSGDADKAREEMRRHVADLRDQAQRITSMVPLGASIRQEKLTPRERIDALLDMGSAFLELERDSDNAATALIIGIGQVAGRLCMIICDDAPHATPESHAAFFQKYERACMIALRNRLALIHLIDSSLPNKAWRSPCSPKMPHAADKIRLVQQYQRLQRAGLTQIGICAGVYDDFARLHVPCVDCRILVTDQNQPPASDDLVDHVAANDAQAIDIARSVLYGLTPPKDPRTTPRIPARAPHFSSDDLLYFAARNGPGVDPHEIMARIVDASLFQPYAACQDDSIISGFAHIHGLPVGILAHHGPTRPAGIEKATRFITQCDRLGLPLLFLQNIAPDTPYDPALFLRHAQLLACLEECALPFMTLVIGGERDPDFTLPCGLVHGACFFWAWPGDTQNSTDMIDPTDSRTILALGLAALWNGMKIDGTPHA